MSTNTNFIGQEFATPRQLVSIKAISASLGIDARSECQRMFDCDLRTLTVNAAARLMADLRARLIRQQAQEIGASEFSLTR
jgi:hypothetical protein